jgi:serine/threonine protein kinase
MLNCGGLPIMVDGGASDDGTPRDEPTPNDAAPSDDAMSTSSSSDGGTGDVASRAPGADRTGTFDGSDLLSDEEAPLEPPSGTKIQRYVIVEKIGHGGMGVVYKAYDPELNRRIAIKLLRPRGGPGTGATHARESRGR